MLERILMIVRALGLATIGAVMWGGLQTVRLVSVRAELSEIQLAAAYAESASHREMSREVSRLTVANKESQDAYNQALAELADHADGSDRTNRVREQEREAITAAAARIAGACGRYAEAAERDLEFTEAERSGFGREAVRAAATAHALRKTLDERRKALEASKQTLKDD